MTPDSQETPGERKRATIFVLSGDYERLYAAFSIAISAAASNMDVAMFFSFWGLRALKKNVPTGQSLFARMLGFFERGDIDQAGPGKHAFLGLGRWMLKKMVKRKNVTSLPELRRLALELGVQLYSCQTAMDVMEIPREKLIDEVTDVAGVGWLVEQAQRSEFTYSF